EVVGGFARIRLADGDHERQPISADIEHAGLGIDRGARPITATGDARHLDCAALRGRREQRAVVVFADNLDCLLAQLGRYVDEVVLAHALDIDRRGLRRERLRLRGTLAGHAGGRHRLLFDRPYRLARDAIEYIEESLLGNLGHRLDAFAIDG